VVPLAVARSQHHVAFTALASGPAVTTHEEEQWSKLAGEEAANPPPLTPAKKAEITRQLQPSGFDPVPLLGRQTVPGIWVFGRQDRSIPAEKSAATLERFRKTNGKDFTVVLFPRQPASSSGDSVALLERPLSGSAVSRAVAHPHCSRGYGRGSSDRHLCVPRQWPPAARALVLTPTGSSRIRARPQEWRSSSVVQPRLRRGFPVDRTHRA
jgi:hypothetical protein